MGYDFSIRSPLKKREAGTPAEVRPVIVSGIITGSLREYSFLLFSKWRVNVHTSSLRKHPFLFAAGDVSRETSLAAKSVEKRMFSQATKRDVWVPGSYRGLYRCIKSSVLLICTVVLLVFCLL